MARDAKLKVGSNLNKSGSPLTSGAARPQTNSYERIVRAAYKCFERYGIDRTSIEDISREAGVTRPTVYRYFAGKVQIVDLMAVEESRKVNVEVRKRLVRTEKFDALMTEALLLIVRIAIENPYIRWILSYHEFETEPDTQLHRMQKVWWGGFLERAAARGELASDLDAEEVIQWLTMAQRLLLTRLESGPVEDPELRRFIRRFIVEPLLRSPAGDTAGG
jgi:AcrR family transcriptional regulator